MEELKETNNILQEIETTKLSRHKRAIFLYPLISLISIVILFVTFAGAGTQFALMISGVFALMQLIGFYFIYKDYKIFKSLKKIDSMYDLYLSSRSLEDALKILKAILNGTGYIMNEINLATRKINYTKKLIDSGDAVDPAYAEEFLNNRIKDKIYHESLIKYYLNILNTLRSDLSNKINEQLPILQSAKGELKETIGGESSLRIASELQKARLDHQIEQFEELQRVLVMM